MKHYIYSLLLTFSIIAKSPYAVVGCHDAAYHSIGKYADLNKQEYCKKHKYDLFIYHESLDTSRHPAWSKILAIQKHLADYKWILWIDSDALIMNHNVKIESLIDNKYDFIVSPGVHFRCNTGIFLIKNSEWSNWFLKTVYEQTQFIYPQCCWEQDAINYLYDSNPEVTKKFKIILPKFLNTHPNDYKDFVFKSSTKYKKGDFIIHFYGNKDKEAQMKFWYEKSLKRKILSHLNRIETITMTQKNDGWINYYHIVPEFIKKYNLSIGCEVGVAFGNHANSILKNSSLKKLYCVDPFMHYDGYEDPFNFEQPYFDVLFENVKNKLSIFNDRCELLRLSSLNAADKFQDATFDFIFLDGNHSYEAVKADLEKWYPKVRPNGFIIGDDYSKSFPGLIKAVDEFLGQKNITVNIRPDNKRVWWIQKP